MRRRSRSRSPAAYGFSLFELLVAMALGLIILAGTVALFRQGVDISYTVTQRAEMQQNARVAANLLSRDLTIAGTALPPGGIALPAGGAATPARRGCDTLGICGNITGGYPNDILYYVTPGNALGAPIPGGAANTDVVTIVYIDDTITITQTLSGADISSDGTALTFQATDQVAINDPATGIKNGDVLLLRNSINAVVAVVTAEPGGGLTVRLDPGDPLNLNYSSGTASSGHVASLGSPGYPPTTVARLLIVTYFVDDSNPTEPRLMRQVNSAAAVPVGTNVENLQISYDIIDTATSTATSGLADPALATPIPASPNQIRKVNIVVTARSPVQGLFRKGFEHVTLATSVSIRNLGWFDRYQ